MATSTRGIGHDIISSDLSAVLALVSDRRNGTAQRVVRTLDGEGLTQIVTSTCIITVGGAQAAKTSTRATTVSERCQSDDGASFTNTYQVAQNGWIVRSRQRHSPLNKDLIIRTLR